MSKKSILIFLLILLGAGAAAAVAFDLPKIFPFDQKRALTEWQEKVFNNRVMYVVEEGDLPQEGYLHAASDRACSGLMYKIRYDGNRYPMISWSWKVNSFPDKSTGENEDPGGWLEKDDFAARVYVIFRNINVFNIKSLEYIWDEDVPEGTIFSSPFTDKIKLIVAESGHKNVGQWVFEERNIAEDYERAFGKKGSLPVGAIAIMTDADSTLSTAEAHYKDLRVGYTQDEK